MANLAYKRVSTDQQSTARQNLVLDEAGIEDPVVFEEDPGTSSRLHPLQCPKFRELLTYARPGDTVHISEMCGKEARRYRRGICGRCVLAERLHGLLDDGTGRIRPELLPLFDTLRQIDQSRCPMALPRPPGRTTHGPGSHGTSAPSIGPLDPARTHSTDPPTRPPGPAPVIARMLGYNDDHTTRLAEEAGGTWRHYAPGDHRR